MTRIIRGIASTVLAAAVVVPTTALAQAEPAAAVADVAPTAAGHEATLGSHTATATASALTTSEDGGTTGFIDLIVTGDGSYSIAPDSLGITTAEGRPVAVAQQLSERDLDTNQRRRSITEPEVIPAGSTVALRFEFSSASAIDDASNLSVLTDAQGVTVAAWHVR